MALNIGNLPVKQVYVGSTLVREVYVGAEKIWPTTDVAWIALGTVSPASDQLRTALLDRGVDYRTVEELPFKIELLGTGSVEGMFRDCSSLTHVPDMDTSSVTRMNSMFYGCSSLTHVPDMDTSSVTEMSNMFYGCSAMTHAPDMDTSKVNNMTYMFRNCSSLTHVPDMDTSSVTRMNSMFRNCSSLTDGNVRLIGRTPNVTTTNMILGSGMTREPFFDTAGNPI